VTPIAVVAAASTPPEGWDARTVDPPGGHVLQGTAWAAHRATQGWRPQFLRFTDGAATLVLTHQQPPLPGFVAYAPRGPISAGAEPDRVAARAAGLAAWARGSGGTILAVDPELDDDPAYDRALAASGYRPTEELQPSRHRMILRWGPGHDPDAVRSGISKQTRQRIRAAERSGTRVVDDAQGQHLEAFAALVDAAAERRQFNFATDRGFVTWWRRVLGAGQARFWVAVHEERVLGGLLAYRQGGHLATAFSGDRADVRRELPGTMHLLRWHAIREAIEAGYQSIDLGGVDTAGARRRPEPGDPGYGLYEHKASFGAEWVASAGAHETVLRPGIYRVGLAARRVRRLIAGLRS